MWIAGIVVAGIGVALFFMGKSQAAKASDIESTPTSTAKELTEMANDIAKEIGSGSFAQVAEVKGTIDCPSPLQAEMSGTPCVYYACTVTREYEETYYENDSEGHRQMRTRRGSDVMQSTVRTTPFKVVDPSGSIEIDPEGATFTAEKTYSQYEQGEGRGNVTFGRFSVNLASFMATGGGRRTLGYRFDENSVPLTANLYVLGEASDAGGRIKVAKPTKKGGRFIISTKSEESLVASAKGTAKGMTIGAYVAAAIGIALVIAGLVVR
ncbi:MAG: E3 ubiquitin ligase family protein [Spirochaetes bacterium]|nr:E3 ubiquitin ligase family protein [Spirochaetota bacterium]